MEVSAEFKIRRYILSNTTPDSVLSTLNYKWSTSGMGYKSIGCPYVDITYYGDMDRDLTLMELRYSEWIVDREEITYTVTGDDGLE